MINWIIDRVDKFEPESVHERAYIENFAYSYRTDELIITATNGEKEVVTEVVDLRRYSIQLTTYDGTET